MTCYLNCNSEHIPLPVWNENKGLASEYKIKLVAQKGGDFRKGFFQIISLFPIVKICQVLNVVSPRPLYPRTFLFRSLKKLSLIAGSCWFDTRNSCAKKAELVNCLKCLAKTKPKAPMLGGDVFNKRDENVPNKITKRVTYLNFWEYYLRDKIASMRVYIASEVLVLYL